MEPMTATKSIQIVSSRPPKDLNVELAPEDTVSAILERVGLDPNQYWLMRPGDQAEYELSEMPYSDVSDGEKLHIIPNSIVGALS